MKKTSVVLSTMLIEALKLRAQRNNVKPATLIRLLLEKSLHEEITLTR